MSTAAVISRQLRNQGRVSVSFAHGNTPYRSRARANSIQPIQVGEKGKKVSRWKELKSRFTLQCFWSVCRLLLGGLFLLSAGMAMSVVGFYAKELSTEVTEKDNKTTEVLNTTRRYHLHNLTYVGPVIMGLGGFVLLALFVMHCDYGPERAGSKVVPIKLEKQSSNDIQMVDKTKITVSTVGPFLTVPEMQPDIR